MVAQEEHMQQMAKTALLDNTSDYKEAQITLFGRELSKQNWEEMTDEQRQTNRELLFKKLQEMRPKE